MCPSEGVLGGELGDSDLKFCIGSLHLIKVLISSIACVLSVLVYAHACSFVHLWCVQTWATLCADVCTCVFICMLVCKHELLSVMVYAHACSFVRLCASIGTCDVEYLHVHVFLFVHFRTVLKFLSSLQTLKILDSRKSLSLAVERGSSSQFSSSSSPCCPW